MKGTLALLVDGEWYTLMTVLFTVTGQNLGSGAHEPPTHISTELCKSKDEQFLQELLSKLLSCFNTPFAVCLFIQE